MAIYKATYTITVLAEGEESEGDALAAYFANAEIEDVLRQMDVGDMIGNVHLQSVAPVPADQVQTELESIGNDGTFFDSCDD